MFLFFFLLHFQRLVANYLFRNPFDRPTADVLLSQHPFCDLDPNYNFYDTELYTKIKDAYKIS